MIPIEHKKLFVMQQFDNFRTISVTMVLLFLILQKIGIVLQQRKNYCSSQKKILY